MRSRSYCKRVRAWSKRAVGRPGPYRSEVRPYRGALGSRTVSLTAAELLTQSDGEAIPQRVRENASRSVSDESMREGQVGGILTLHEPEVSIWISLVIHVFDNCDSIRSLSRLKYAHWHASSGVTTTMSTHFPDGSCGPLGKWFSIGSRNWIWFPEAFPLSLIHSYVR